MPISRMFMRKNPNAVFINQKMDMTPSLMRKDVVINKPPVSQILQRWPALFRESQVKRNAYVCNMK